MTTSRATGSRSIFQRRVLRKYPQASFTENHGKHMQRWFLWRDNMSRTLTDDLLGCGMTKDEAWTDAARNLK